MFNWLGLPWLPEVNDFILEHQKTDEDEQNPFSLYRIPESRIATWMNNEWNDIQHIQEVCAEPINSFGYLLVQNKSTLNSSNNELTEKTFSPNIELNYQSTIPSSSLTATFLNNIKFVLG